MWKIFATPITPGTTLHLRLLKIRPEQQCNALRRVTPTIKCQNDQTNSHQANDIQQEEEIAGQTATTSEENPPADH